MMNGLFHRMEIFYSFLSFRFIIQMVSPCDIRRDRKTQWKGDGYTCVRPQFVQVTEKML